MNIITHPYGLKKMNPLDFIPAQERKSITALIREIDSEKEHFIENWDGCRRVKIHPAPDSNRRRRVRKMKYGKSIDI